MTTVPDQGHMLVFYAMRFPSAGSPNEYANVCRSAGNVNNNTSLKLQWWCSSPLRDQIIALPIFLPCFTPSTGGLNPTEMQISYIWTTYVSSSDLCITHIRAAWPITVYWIKLWMRYHKTARTVSILGFYITAKETASVSSHAPATMYDVSRRNVQR